MAVLQRSPWYQEIKEEGREEAMIIGVAIAWELKFGAIALELLPEIRQIADGEKLQAILEGIKTVTNLEELRQIYHVESL